MTPAAANSATIVFSLPLWHVRRALNPIPPGLKTSFLPFIFRVPASFLRAHIVDRLPEVTGIPITMVGLDVTNRVVLTEEHVRTLEAGPTAVSQGAGKIARAVFEYWRQQGFVSKPILFDEVAIAEFLDPKLLRLEDYYIDVETSGDITAGETVGYSPIHGEDQRWIDPNAPHTGSRDPVYYRAPDVRGSPPSVYRPGASSFFTKTYKPNAKVAVDVDAERFFRLFIGRLSGKQVPLEG